MAKLNVSSTISLETSCFGWFRLVVEAKSWAKCCGTSCFGENAGMPRK
jgi:hypothetical protein